MYGLTDAQMTELLNILEANNETLSDFIQICDAIKASSTGKVNAVLCDVYGKWTSPADVYNAMLEYHTFIPVDEISSWIWEKIENETENNADDPDFDAVDYIRLLTDNKIPDATMTRTTNGYVYHIYY